MPKRHRQARIIGKLEHVQKKLTDFFDQNMLQVVVLERILIDRVLPPDRNTL
jgi:hypothetical protein